ncbi:hypothetical protein [Mammaliicoccus sciuri]|uniref:hypothetical protein n=1 Tax=Mammaliicoccus sciuri TaxID=1296 RepID=UPI003F555DDD
MFENKEELIEKFGIPYGEYGIKTIKTLYLFVEKEFEDKPFDIYFALLNEIINEDKKPLYELSLRKTNIELSIDDIFMLEESEIESLIQPINNKHYDIATRIFHNKTDVSKALIKLDSVNTIKDLFVKYGYSI